MTGAAVVVTSFADAARLLASVGLDVPATTAVIEEALAEDLGARGLMPGDAAGRVDVTSVATVAADAVASGAVVARAAGTVAGLPVAAAALALVCARSGAFTVTVRRSDGDRVERDDVLLEVSGNTRAVLTAERVALNLLTMMSGTATATRAWADALAGTRARVRDSRKTLPGLRALQKYAVRVGGGVNHRLCLADQALIKDNHVLAAGGVVPAYQRVRAAFPDLHVQVEVTTAEQAAAVVEAGALDVLLDNMGPDRMRDITAAYADHPVTFEASGGLLLERAAAVAATGVDFVAVGAITHSAGVLDCALDLHDPR